VALVQAGRFYDSLAAGAAQSLLTDARIDSFIFDMGMTLQAVGFAVPVRLMVDEDDLENAQALLTAADGG
jgi:hypothetical protein